MDCSSFVCFKLQSHDAFRRVTFTPPLRSSLSFDISCSASTSAASSWKRPESVSGCSSSWFSRESGRWRWFWFCSLLRFGKKPIKSIWRFNASQAGFKWVHKALHRTDDDYRDRVSFSYQTEPVQTVFNIIDHIFKKNHLWFHSTVSEFLSSRK